MEGTLNTQQTEMVSEMQAELNTPPPLAIDAIHAHLVVGEEYKITGGKFKKYKVGTLVKINPTYSDVKVSEGAVMMATGNIGEDKMVKCKNCYLLRKNPPGIDMPEASDLLVVEDLEKHLEQFPNADIAPVPEQGKNPVQVQMEDMLINEIQGKITNQRGDEEGALTTGQAMELIKLVLDLTRK